MPPSGPNSTTLTVFAERSTIQRPENALAGLSLNARKRGTGPHARRSQRNGRMNPLQQQDPKIWEAIAQSDVPKHIRAFRGRLQLILDKNGARPNGWTANTFANHDFGTIQCLSLCFTHDRPAMPHMKLSSVSIPAHLRRVVLAHSNAPPPTWMSGHWSLPA